MSETPDSPGPAVDGGPKPLLPLQLLIKESPADGSDYTDSDQPGYYQTTHFMNVDGTYWLTLHYDAAPQSPYRSTRATYKLAYYELGNDLDVSE